MRNSRLSPWLVPTFGGSVAGASIATTLVCALGPTDPLLGSRFWNWVASMLVAVPLALVLGLVLCLTDVVLLRWREIPKGRRAWTSSAIAPILVGLVYAAHRPGQYDPGLMMLLATVVPMAAVSLGTRWLLGKRARR